MGEGSRTWASPHLPWLTLGGEPRDRCACSWSLLTPEPHRPPSQAAESAPCHRPQAASASTSRGPRPSAETEQMCFFRGCGARDSFPYRRTAEWLPGESAAKENVQTQLLENGTPASSLLIGRGGCEQQGAGGGAGSVSYGGFGEKSRGSQGCLVAPYQGSAIQEKA